MSLRKKIFLILLSGALIITAVSLSVGIGVLLESYIRLERDVVSEQFARLDNALKNSVSRLEKTARELGKQPASADSAPPARLFKQWDLNLMLRFDARGELQQSGLYEISQQRFADLSQMRGLLGSLVPQLNPPYSLLYPPLAAQRRIPLRESRQGIVLLEEGPLLFVSRPASDGGHLVLGVYLRGERLNRLIAYQHETIGLDLYRLDAPLPSAAASAYALLRDDTSANVQYPSAHFIDAYGLLDDALGEPVLLVHLRLSRSLYLQGREQLLLLSGAILFCLLVFLVWLAWLLERLVLQRIARLDAEVKRVGDGGQLAARISAQGGDELGRLGTAINTMLERLEHSQQAQQRSEREVLRLLDENRRLARRLINLQEEERKTLARELHDESGQSLTAIQAYAGGIQALAGGHQAARVRDSAAEIAAAARHMYDVIHSIMHRLHPGALDSLGLRSALEKTVQDWRERYPSIRCELRSEGDVDVLDETRRIHIYRLVQEALTNIAKHAQASAVSIQLRVDAHRLALRIRDNGVGMDINAERSGLGLVSMRERVQGLGGHFQLYSAIGQGVTLDIQISLQDGV